MSIVVNGKTYINGKDYILYHVRKPLNAISVRLGSPPVMYEAEIVRTIRSVLSNFTEPYISTAKCQAILNVLQGDNVETHEQTPDHTLAFAYDKASKSIIIAYAKPAEDEVFDRKMGHRIAVGRLDTAIKKSGSAMLYKEWIPNSISKTLAVYIARAKKFYHDCEINHIRIYHPSGSFGYVDVI